MELSYHVNILFQVSCEHLGLNKLNKKLFVLISAIPHSQVSHQIHKIVHGELFI